MSVITERVNFPIEIRKLVRNKEAVKSRNRNLIDKQKTKNSSSQLFLQNQATDEDNYYSKKFIYDEKWIFKSRYSF